MLGVAARHVVEPILEARVHGGELEPRLVEEADPLGRG